MERKSRKLAFLIALLLIMCTLLEPATVKAAAVLKYGSRGDDVVNLQSRLKRWSYYFGSIDGMGRKNTVCGGTELCNGLSPCTPCAGEEACTAEAVKG